MLSPKILKKRFYIIVNKGNDMKLCSKCKQKKELTEFRKYDACRDGLNCWCNECCSKYAKQHYQNDDENVKRRTEASEHCKPLLNEEFRIVAGCQRTWVSNLGRVLTKTKWGISHIRKPVLRKGSPYYQIYINEPPRHITYIHVLVCETFHGSRPKGLTKKGKPLYQVSHKDNNPTNNNANNLEWATVKENFNNSRHYFGMKKGFKHSEETKQKMKGNRNACRKNRHNALLKRKTQRIPETDINVWEVK